MMVKVGLNHSRQSIRKLLESLVVQSEDLLRLLSVARVVENSAQSEKVHGRHRVGAGLCPVLVILQSQDYLWVTLLAGEVSALCLIQKQLVQSPLNIYSSTQP